MKLLNIQTALLIAAAVAFVACDDDDDYSAGKPTAADCPALTFGSDNVQSVEMDPADDTKVDITIDREGQTPAATYKIKVLTNTENIFDVPETVTFAEGQTEATVTVTFDDAAVGTSYSLEIGLEDDDVDAYSSDTYQTYSYTVVRVKWNTLGTGQWVEDFWYGFCASVEIQQRDDDPSSYRIVSPYTDDLIEAYGEGTGTYQQYLVFTLTSMDYVTWDECFYINTWELDYDQEIIGWMHSALSSSYADYDELSYAVRDDDGNILYFQICPFWYMDGVGGWAGSYCCYLAFPGYDLNSEGLIGEDGEPTGGFYYDEI